MTRSELFAIVRATGCVEEVGKLVFLRDPAWRSAELEEFERIKAALGARQAAIPSGWLCIRTGGSGGALKFAVHDENTLSAAVRGFGAHFGIERVNAVDVLPPYHVSGFMARVRCAATGGEHVAWDWKELEAGRRPALRRAHWGISLVPTQLQRLLANAEAVAWLRQFSAIFLGGGPAWAELLEAAAKAELRVAPSYGMTETAAMVAALRPEEFLAGARSCGTALPHARVAVNEEGVICVSGESVCRGSFAASADAAAAHGNPIGYHGAEADGEGGRTVVTEDLGRIDERGHLHVLGRRDAAIITGGKKVQPADVEAALRASGEFADVAVTGVPDPEWGEAVVACYVRGAREPDAARAMQGLAAHQRPKRFVAIAAEAWPRNAQGKVNRLELARLATGG